MRKIALLFTFTVLFAGLLTAQFRMHRQSFGPHVETKVMTFNIRYSTKTDGVNSWDNRKEKIVETILNNEVDILGVQEALHSQVIDLEKGLKSYEWMGVGRDDGIEKGEYSPIFYNKNKFSEVGSGYFWLSESPMEAGSKGWDAACTRIATWAKLRDNRNGRVIFVLNTHFDHVGEQARRESAKLLLQKINVYTKKNKFPIIVTGDFNSTPNGDAIQILKNRNNPQSLTDARDVTLKTSGPNWTFHGFGKVPAEKRPLIDYVFVKNKISVLDYQVIEGKLPNNKWLSDHCSVLVTVEY